MLIILAGITLNAVIGEDGIIFQAKDTKNMISNETQYDNQQLAQLQNELKDNQLYSGIGIIPGTDTGGGSEGGENGTVNPPTNSGNSNQGGTNTNTGGDNTNTGGGDNQNQNATVRPSENQNPGGGTIVDGKTDEDPKFYVVSGEEIAASFYQSDVTIQIFTNERAKKIKYILTTTVQEISDELYPSGLVRELDIENGGTLTFTKDGEYTITAYAYDTVGNKSNPTIMWFKRQTGGSTTGGITVSIASGNEGANKWYTSNVTLRVLGTDTGSKKIKYRVRGTATSTGQIGDKDVIGVGTFDSGEVEITNGTTFRIVADGTYSITAYSYDAGGMRLSSSEVLTLKKDATRPTVQSYTGEQIPGQGFKVKVNAVDNGAGLTSNAYTYRYKESSSLAEYTSEVSGNTEKLYTGLNQTKTYDMYVMVTDEAGNVAITDVIARPSLWISNNITVGETVSNGVEGARKYSRSETVALTFRGQDSNNVDIMKTTYQVIGTVDKEGSIAGTNVTVGQELKDEYALNDKETRTIQLQADGNWTVKVHNYNKEGKLVTTNTVEVTRDITPPTIASFTKSNLTKTGFTGNVSATDKTSDFATKNDAYQYRTGTTVIQSQAGASYTFSNLSLSTIKNINVVVKDRAGNTSPLNVTSSGVYLVDIVNVGDYVGYDLGDWESTVANPTKNATFGGYTSGTNKGTGLNSTPSGWRVMSKSGSGASGTVTLVSAGNPVNGYYGNSETNRTDMIYSMNAFAQNSFVNGLLASKAEAADFSDATALKSISAYSISQPYWFASDGSKVTSYSFTKGVTAYGSHWNGSAWENLGQGYYCTARNGTEWVGMEMVSNGNRYTSSVYGPGTEYKASSFTSDSNQFGVYSNANQSGSSYIYYYRGGVHMYQEPWAADTTTTYKRPGATSVYGAVNRFAGVRIKVTTLPGVICDGGVTFLGNDSWSMAH